MTSPPVGVDAAVRGRVTGAGVGAGAAAGGPEASAL